MNELDAFRKKERVYEIGLQVDRLYPVQKLKRAQRIFLGKVYQDIKRRTRTQTAEEAKRPDIAIEEKRLVEKWEEAEVFTFPVGDDGMIDLTADLTGMWGAIHKAFVEYWTSLRKADYIREMLNAVIVERVDGAMLVKPKNGSGDNDPMRPFSLPVPRSRGQTRQIEYYDYLEDHEIRVRLRIPSELPLSAEEFGTLLHGLEIIRLHPLRRGQVRITDVKAIQNPYAGKEVSGPDRTIP